MKFNKICVPRTGIYRITNCKHIRNPWAKSLSVWIPTPTSFKRSKMVSCICMKPGLRTLVQAALRSGNLSIHQEPEEADAFIIAVPTPFHRKKKRPICVLCGLPAEAIMPKLNKGNLVILESTSPTAHHHKRGCGPSLRKAGLKPGTDFHLAYSPERVFTGTDLKRIDRKCTRDRRHRSGFIRSRPRTLQYFRARRDHPYQFDNRGDGQVNGKTPTAISILPSPTNFHRLAERFDINVWEAIKIANRHPRVSILNPGPGVGGHCISVDPWFLVDAAPDITPLIHTAREVNDAQPAFVVNRVRSILGGDLSNSKISILGTGIQSGRG